MFHSLIALKRLAVQLHACVALDLSVAGFKPSGVDHSNWLEIDSGRNCNQSTADTVQHMYRTTGSTLLERVPLQFLNMVVRL